MLLIALALAVTEPPARPMTVEVVSDPITDEIKASATLRDRGERLAIACEPSEYDGIRVSFHSANWLARGNLFSGERPLIYRFDDHPPRRMLWHVRERSGRLRGQSRVRPFLRSLIVAEQLVIRARNIEDREIDIPFRIAGARPAIERLLEACGDADLRKELFGPS